MYVTLFHHWAQTITETKKKNIMFRCSLHLEKTEQMFFCEFRSDSVICGFKLSTEKVCVAVRTFTRQLKTSVYTHFHATVVFISMCVWNLVHPTFSTVYTWGSMDRKERTKMWTRVRICDWAYEWGGKHSWFHRTHDDCPGKSSSKKIKNLIRRRVCEDRQMRHDRTPPARLHF